MPKLTKNISSQKVIIKLNKNVIYFYRTGRKNIFKNSWITL